jgi:hypothetical protein
MKLELKHNMEITHGLKKLYGFYVGAVSKVIYPISLITLQQEI